MNISIIRNVKTPHRGTPESAGLDFFIPEDLPWQYYGLNPGEDILIPSGIHVCLPKHTMLMADNKSGIATKLNLIVGAKIIDSDYQGEIHLHLINVGKKQIMLKPGDKIVQLIHIPILLSDVNVVPLEKLYGFESHRGTGGFGSTGL